MRLTAVEEGHLRNGMPGTIGIAAVFPGAPFDLARVRSRVRDRWGGLDRMSLVLRRPGGPAALSGHRWRTARPFDPVAHVTATDQDLRSLLTDGVSDLLPAERPLWRLLVTRQCIVLLAHHALLDGRSLETLFRLLMDEAVTPRPGVPAGADPAAVVRQRSRVGAGSVYRELRRIGFPGQPLPATPELRPSVAVVELDPQVMRAARRQPAGGRGATLNELLLSAYAGALHACYGPLRTWPKAPTPSTPRCRSTCGPARTRANSATASPRCACRCPSTSSPRWPGCRHARTRSPGSTAAATPTARSFPR
ncbi:wax ester/triacylglycerol synthase domain-containing protein [Streptomyces sp. NBC_00443]|uniref:wax ester/triacylglycerol synthase domain-containing protein n=1 Tax=Streptomyces sp. NBC_00443 TaxID=2975743 RepID=UPI002E1DFB31